jgi:hypothetical protein
MSTKASASNLNQGLRELTVSWQATKAYWRDQKALEFEQKYLERLPAQVAMVKTVMDDMDILLRKVRNDCE